MKSVIIILSFVVCLFFCGSYTVKKTAGSHPGSTGAPLDLTCAQSGCHSDAVVVLNASSSTTLGFSSIDSTYTPNLTYNLIIKVKGSGSTVKFGFECGAIKDADSLNIGEFIITDLSPVRTQTLSHPIGSDLRYSVTHKTAGTSATSTNFDQWTFSWKAPSANVGNITFYYAAMVTNNNGMETGDRVFLNSFTIKPALPTSIKEIENEKEFKAFYIASEREMVVSYKLKSKKDVVVSLYDDLGREVLNVPYTNRFKGTQTENISVPSSIKPGVYFIHLEIDGGSVSKKIVVQ